ncbi:MAG: hypothetical protein ABIO39_13175 [Caulobacteraceae bacterium]
MPAANSVNSAAKNAQRTVDDARAFGEDLRDAVPELKRAAERALREGLGQFKGQSRETMDAAGEQLENARLYVIDRVQERPFTTTLAALGAGFLIGLLFAGRRR